MIDDYIGHRLDSVLEQCLEGGRCSSKVP
jgi:hypothetical protein